MGTGGSLRSPLGPSLVACGSPLCLLGPQCHLPPQLGTGPPKPAGGHRSRPGLAGKTEGEGQRYANESKQGSRRPESQLQHFWPPGGLLCSPFFEDLRRFLRNALIADPEMPLGRWGEGTRLCPSVFIHFRE